MKKKFLMFILSLLFIPNIIKAASANVQISAPSSVYVGDTVTVSVTISSSASLGSWQYTVSYDDSILSGSNQGQMVASYAENSGKTSVTNSWTFRAASSGTVSFSIPSIDVYAFDDESSMKIGGSTSVSINVVKPSSSSGNGGSTGYSNYNYSDDNSLSSLIIDGFDLDFDSSITEYSITVPNDTKKVKIGATANDSNASVSGIGDYDVKEGNNDIEVYVTAENGDVRVYKISVVVKELSPIEVKIDDKKYNIVRKSDKLPSVNKTFKESKILIKGESVPCYHSDLTDIYLVGLMDEKGKVSLYRYDAKSDKFYDYTEINVSGLFISLLSTDDIPTGYKSGMVKIGDKEYSGFIKEGSYSLLYGMNLETGKENFYSYDSDEGTLQRFSSSVVVKDKANSYVFFGLVGLCIFEFIMIIVCVISKNRHLKKFLNNKLSEKTEFEKTNDVESSDDTSCLTDSSSNYESYYENSEFENADDMESSDITSDLTDEYLSSNYENNEFDNSIESVQDEDSTEEQLGHTALISDSVNNVFDNSVNRKDSKRRDKRLSKKRNSKDDDEMFKF